VRTRELARVSPLLTAGLPLTRSALEFAKERYGGDVQHPLEVAAELRHAGCPDEVVASGVLHDVLEATETDVSELAERFGKHVARLVQAVSEDLSIEDYEDRKDALRAQVARARREAAIVFAADKVSRVRELPSRIDRGLSPDDARRKLDHYQASLVMLQRRLGRAHPLVKQLGVELERVDAGVRT
jgi:(p)ppGpp synthase/HD superfamily hydrolase